MGTFPPKFVDVISSHPDVYGLERARKLRLPSQVVDFRKEGDGFSSALTDAVDKARPDLVVMAGFIRKWEFPSRYNLRVLNIHPALLPAFGGKGFYGGRVHQAVIDSGAKFSGCTVHFANLEYDRGPIILQRVHSPCCRTTRPIRSQHACSRKSVSRTPTRFVTSRKTDWIFQGERVTIRQ